MSKYIVLTALGSLALSSDAHATNFAVITNPPTLLNLFVLLGACAAAIICIQVFGVLRGGYLGRSWQMFVGGFVLLALSQISMLVQSFEVLTVPGWVTPLLMLTMVATFFWGVFESRKVLG